MKCAERNYFLRCAVTGGKIVLSAQSGREPDPK